MTNPMVPSTDWSGAAEGFRQEIGKQVTLCGYCLTKDGNTNPPPTIIIYDGYSLCLDHFPIHQNYLRSIGRLA